jgi:hypothetical protein
MQRAVVASSAFDPCGACVLAGLSCHLRIAFFLRELSDPTSAANVDQQTGEVSMNARVKTGNAEDSGAKSSAPFWLQSTLNDYEVEEVTMWQLADLLAQTRDKAREPDAAPASVVSAH